MCFNRHFKKLYVLCAMKTIFYFTYFFYYFTYVFALILVISLLSMEGQRALKFHQKYLNLCSQDERRPYGFGTTWAWVINDRIYIYGRTNSLITSLISDLYLFSLFHTFSAFTLQFSQSLWCISRIVLNISKDLCVFLKTIHTNSTTQWISWKSQ